MWASVNRELSDSDRSVRLFSLALAISSMRLLRLFLDLSSLDPGSEVLERLRLRLVFQDIELVLDPR